MTKYGKKEGLYQQWHSNGQKRQEVIYKDDKLNGLCVGWFQEAGNPIKDHGQKHFETFYINDTVNGLSQSWHSNGQLLL